MIHKIMHGQKNRRRENLFFIQLGNNINIKYAPQLLANRCLSVFFLIIFTLRPSHSWIVFGVIQPGESVNPQMVTNTLWLRGVPKCDFFVSLPLSIRGLSIWLRGLCFWPSILPRTEEYLFCRSKPIFSCTQSKHTIPPYSHRRHRRFCRRRGSLLFDGLSH